MTIHPQHNDIASLNYDSIMTTTETDEICHLFPDGFHVE